jgi:excinuclease ABC subunit B
LVGINLLREGLDLPEVALVGILDADKEGFLRSETSLVQTIGRAARHLNGRVILYADKETRSIKAALRETNRRRQRQADYNDTHGVVPTQVRRAPEAVMVERDELEGALADIEIETPTDLAQTQELIEQLKAQMFEHAKALEFEQAAAIRDKIALLERYALGF